jgi:hypothetical protein
MTDDVRVLLMLEMSKLGAVPGAACTARFVHLMQDGEPEGAAVLGKLADTLTHSVHDSAVAISTAVMTCLANDR